MIVETRKKTSPTTPEIEKIRMVRNAKTAIEIFE